MKLGLIAMSGTRAQNAELTALGLTLPGFVERGKTIASLPSLGLLTLAGMTPPEVDVEYVEVRDLDGQPAIPSGYDAVAISSFTAQIGQAYRLADAYRAQGTSVILGGLHVTALPDEAAQHADAIVLGEGESMWPTVLRDLLAGRLQPRYDARSVSFDLARGPLPRFDLLDISRYNRLTVQTQRGCPHRCEFCASSVRLSPRYKVKPVDKVIAEIRRIKELWPRPFIELADDNTFVDRKHSKQLVRAIAAEGIRWFTETDISVADDEELLELMRDSGCAQILIGLESPSRPALDGLERRSNWKLKRRDRYAWAIERIQSHGITVNGCFVLGLDHTGPESFAAVSRFVRESGLYEVQITILTPFPGTPLYDRLRAERRLFHDSQWERYTLFDVNFQPASMSVSALETGFRELAELLYSAPETRARRRRFVHSFRAGAASAARSGGGQWAAE
jgi:radical SAM superfamily enzyme YgiQ (UPF0313 family)